jgi:hypothetical protein
MNEITIHGNLTDEPTLHYSPSGVGPGIPKLRRSAK